MLGHFNILLGRTGEKSIQNNWIALTDIVGIQTYIYSELPTFAFSGQILDILNILLGRTGEKESLYQDNIHISAFLY